MSADYLRAVRLRRVEELLAELYDAAIKPVLPEPKTIGEQVARRKHREKWVAQAVLLTRALAGMAKAGVDS